MALGAVVDGQCLSPSDAEDRFFSRSAPFMAPVSGGGYIEVRFENVSGTWQKSTSVFNQSGALVSTSLVPADIPPMAPCDPVQNFNDGASIGGLVALVLFSAWGVKSLRRAL